MNDPASFPAAARWLTAATNDLRGFLDLFARQISAVLPVGHVQVRRRFVRILPPMRMISSLHVHLGEWHYLCENFTGASRFLRARDSRGIALQSEDIGIAEWLLAFEQDIKSHAERAGLAGAALDALLSGSRSAPQISPSEPIPHEEAVMASELAVPGLPDGARRRFSPGGEGRRRAFTSDLSINEYAVVRQAGFQPVGLVLGSSIYHVGLQIAGFRTNQELDVGTRAMYHARELAIHRLMDEAIQAGADGVIGVRLRVQTLEWNQEVLEFVAMGTAVRHSEGRPEFKSAGGRPFTSHLSGQDFWTLLQTGARPLALVMGCCVYHIAHQGILQSLRSIGRNVEMPEFTQAYYNARELAMERMQQEAEAVGASGIVGVELSENSQIWESHVIEYFALGTAITEMDQTGATPDALRLQTVLSLSD